MITFGQSHFTCLLIKFKRVPPPKRKMHAINTPKSKSIRPRLSSEAVSLFPRVFQSPNTLEKKKKKKEEETGHYSPFSIPHFTPPVLGRAHRVHTRTHTHQPTFFDVSSCQFYTPRHPPFPSWLPSIYWKNKALFKCWLNGVAPFDLSSPSSPSKTTPFISLIFSKAANLLLRLLHFSIISVLVNYFLFIII